MFRLHKVKSEKSVGGLKIDFNFSNFHASQVPKGWDKLFISIISIETGKTLVKSGKVSVRNGNCRWTETLSESILISQEDTTKELEQCLLKLVVAMGSARSGILGEATVNLASYLRSKASVPIALPLKKCNHGTMLQVNIQCLTPRTNVRNEQSKADAAYVDDINVDCDDMENKSDVSDSCFTRSIGSSSSNCMDSSSHLGESGDRDTTFSASGSRNSFDSMEGSSGIENSSPRSNLSGISDNLIGRQASIDSQTTSPYASYLVNDPPRSNHSSFSKVSRSGRHLLSQTDDFGQTSRALVSPHLRNAVSSKEHCNSADATNVELRAEAKMWERNARKLMLDLERLREAFSEQSKSKESVEIDLLASRTECDGLKQEIEQLRILLEESKERATGDLKFQPNDIQKEMENELKFQKESNANLVVQLQKTQESNIELLSYLQELEDTIEKQKMEVANSTKKTRQNSCDSDLEGSTVENPLTDSLADFEPEDIRNMGVLLQQFQESQKNLENTIQFLEKTLEDKNREIESERGSKSQSLLDCEREWRFKLAAIEEENIKLEGKLSEVLTTQGSKETEIDNDDDCNPREFKALKEKVQELEKDCNELTEENLELLFKLKESGKDLQKSSASSSSSSKCPRCDSFSSPEAEESQLSFKICQSKEEGNTEVIPIGGAATSNLQVRCMSLENKCIDLEIQLQTFRDKASHLDGELHKFCAKAEEQEIEIASLQHQLQCCRVKEEEKKDHLAKGFKGVQSSEPGAAVESFDKLSELLEHIQLFLAKVTRKECAHLLFVDIECNDSTDTPQDIDSMTKQMQVRAFVKNFIQLNKLFEAKCELCKEEKQFHEENRETSGNANEVQNKPTGNSLKQNSTRCSSQLSKSSAFELDYEVRDLSDEFSRDFSEKRELKAEHLLMEKETRYLCQREVEAHVSDFLLEKGQVEQNMEKLQRERSITSNSSENLQSDTEVHCRSLIDSHNLAQKSLERRSSELESSKLQLEFHVSELEEENVQLSERISGLEAQLRYLTDERESSRLELQHSASCVMSLQDEVRRLEDEMGAQKADMKQQLLDMQKRWFEAQEENKYIKKVNPKLQATAESVIEECSFLQKSNRELKKQNMDLHDQCTVLEAELRETQKCFSSCLAKIEALEGDFSSLLVEISMKEKILYSEVDALRHENEKHKKELQEETQLFEMYLEKKSEVENLQNEIAHLSKLMCSSNDETEKRASEPMLEVSNLRANNTKLETALKKTQEKLKLKGNNLDKLRMESEAKEEALSLELANLKQKQEILLADHEKVLGLLEEIKSTEQNLKSQSYGMEFKLKTLEYERLQLLNEISGLKVQLEKITELQGEILSLKCLFNEAKLENERLEASLQLSNRDYEEMKAERASLVQKMSCMQNAMSAWEDCKHSNIALQEKILRLEGDLIAREASCVEDAKLKNELGRVRRTNNQLQRKIKCEEEEKEELLKVVQGLQEESKRNTGKQERSDSSMENAPLYPELDVSSTSTSEESVPSEVLGNEIADTLRTLEMSRTQRKSMASEGQDGSTVKQERLPDEDQMMLEDVCNHKVSVLEAELRDIHERYFHLSLKYAEVESHREELLMKLAYS